MLRRSSRTTSRLAACLALKRLANSNAPYGQVAELMQPNVLASGLAAASGAPQKAGEVGWILLHLGFAHGDLRET
jgi:hypothetical protein